VHAGDCGGAHSYSQTLELQAAGTELAFHPLAEIFLLLDGADFDALVEDITAGVEPTFTPFRGDDPWPLSSRPVCTAAISLNRHANHHGPPTPHRISCRNATFEKGEPAA
jgi:hypothetical protein